jgi:hypothetical protein
LFDQNEGLIICGKRNQILRKIKREQIQLALQYAVKSDYDKARDCIIDLLKNLFKSKK